LSVTSPGGVNIDQLSLLSGGFLQAAWNHQQSANSAPSLIFNYTSYRRADILGEKRKTFDLDFQHNFTWGTRQDILWGLGYTYSLSDSSGSLSISLIPNRSHFETFNSFIQDEIALIRNRLFLTLGTKLAHDYYAGFVPMPTARATFSLDDRNILWAAVSRAVPTPSVIDESVRLNFAGFPGPGGIPVLVATIGNPHFQSEDLLAYEFGHRTAVSTHLSLDLAAF
jgi:iron complex outermembrane recepter protein